MPAPQHVLDPLVRRLPDGFLLRGSLLTRQWAAGFPRVAEDIDLLGTFPYDADEVVRRLATAFEGVADGAMRGRAIWSDTPFPGVRVTVPTGGASVTIDVGFHDPVVPPAIALVYVPERGESFPVRAVHRVTMVAWKLHGLSEWGDARWRCKDLLDLWLLCRDPFDVPVATVSEAIEVAFTSRGCDVRDVGVLRGARWGSPQARLRWSTWVRQSGLPVSDEPSELVADIDARLAPSLEELLP
ncbi:MAG: nucleotidyl transferase AbiEii/AbiGii toxin family protein [Alphaproteobacteria bacterium]|nr:nucleotidyl transferase AbiEii/AbiGii toxin family protein [Alphaproteobacteria bacterium]